MSLLSRPGTPLASVTSRSYSSLSSVTPSPSISNTSSNASNKAENVLVTVRCRPLTKLELLGQAQVAFDVDDEMRKVSVAASYVESKGRTNIPEYFYDEVVTGSDNKDLYERSVQDLVRSTMEGFNGVFLFDMFILRILTEWNVQHAYNATHRICLWPNCEWQNIRIDEQPGVIPQAVDDVFTYIREAPNREFLLRVSYLEIYNETIRDLLAPEVQDLRIHEDKKRGVYVSPQKEEIVTTPKQVMKIIQKGEANRHVSTTDYNLHSSRSHTIFQLVVESRERGTSGIGSPLRLSRTPGIKKDHGGSVRISQLNLIDLAGSEKAATALDRRKEGAYINKSSGHIPYRDSKLTRILQSSLSGNARISVICTMSPSALAMEESHNTLKFAARVKKVVTRAGTNAIMDDKALLQKYRVEIAELKTKLMHTNEVVGNEKDKELSKLKAERQKHEEEMMEMQLVRTALKERIEHLTKLILTSQSITSKSILDWSPAVSNNRRSVIVGVPLGLGDLTKEKEKDDAIKKLTAMLHAKEEDVKDLSAKLEQVATTDDDTPVEEQLKSHKRQSVIFTDQDRQELNRLRQTNFELQMTVEEQAAKLVKLREEVEAEFRLQYRPFDQTPEYMDTRHVIEEQRDLIADMEEQAKNYKSTITELRNVIRKNELAQFEKAEKNAMGSGIGVDGRKNGIIDLATGGLVAHVKELEALLEKERRQRQEEQNRNTERIASLEAELTITKALPFYVFALLAVFAVILAWVIHWAL
ncbi:P-loop containing nucleoside triphosphate hydrolase protein [Jimgerdemannia flammicorona]|uniref:Kinesin-like protein n=1 Tax=Jimgerdemannia flammicorona TaxID=994334 RepID=A0A433DEZ8_9FUNG|nr:P-loop containing nucleoside triphosphate hydrolase protein [Jimgerdemannia flammicorona]